MARKSFSLNTEPHVAEVGEHLFEFRPEVYGDEFLDGYTAMIEAQQALSGDDGRLDPAKLRELIQQLKDFLVPFMLEESAARFQETKLPQRVYMQLLEWIAEVYGGAAGKEDSRPPTSSGGSATASPKAGRSGRAPSRSRASMPARGV